VWGNDLVDVAGSPTKSRPKLAYRILPTYIRSKSWPMQKAASRSRILRDCDSLCFSWLSPQNGTVLEPCTYERDWGYSG